MRKHKALKITSYVLAFLFLIELIPTISMQSSKEEYQSRMESSEYRIVTGIVENYHFYTSLIEILISDEVDLETNWFHTIYNMRDEYQDSKLVNDIYEGMTITITYYPDIEDYSGNEYSETASLYSSEKTYISLDNYLQLQEDDYDSFILSGYIHLGIDITFFIGAITCMVLYFKLNGKQEEVNEKINH